MEFFKELVKESFALLTKKRWLKSIDRAANKYHDLEHKARVQAKVVHALCDRYKELYGEDLRKGA